MRGMYAKPPGGKLWHALHLGVVAAAATIIAAALSGRSPKSPETRTVEASVTRAETPPAREPEKPLATKTGLASFYGAAGGKELFAAHPSYARGTLVRVTNLQNGREVVVRVSDRGPKAGKQAAGFIIDLSRAAARDLDFVRAGVARVRVEVLEWGGGRGGRGKFVHAPAGSSIPASSDTRASGT
jgi:rare lipoprotein A